MGFFLSLEDDLFFFFFFDECSLDLVLSGFSAALLVDGLSGLLVTFSWLLPTFRTSLIGFSPLSAFSSLSAFSNGKKNCLFRSASRLFNPSYDTGRSDWPMDKLLDLPRPI